jgi:MSHA pilin protein MshC
MSRPRGYSLVELVVTLVIAGILAAFFVPRLTDTESKATWFHEEVTAAIRYAQRQAVAQKRCVFVRISSTQLRLVYADAACALPVPASSAAPLTLLATMAAGKSSGDPYVLDAPSGVTLSPAVDFSFNALGQPSGPQSLSVGGKAITVVAETGYVRDN